MLIDSKYNVPYIYRNSRDYQSILKLLDLLLTAIKEGIDDMLQIFDPMKCPEQLLPLLASLVGYQYDIKETVQANRIIIDNYQQIIHNRGSEIGIKTAAALSFNAEERDEEVENASMFDVEYSRKEGKIVIYVYYPNYLQKIRDLLERARPAGVPLVIVPAHEIQTVDKVEIHDYIYNDRMPYDKTRYSINDPLTDEEKTNRKGIIDEKGKSRVGFTEITNKEEPKADPEYPDYDLPQDTRPKK